ncbi:MAG: hypothetical protein K9L82_16625 [Chromatiaceae bacterium]|nr:hypothetical protein [Chromatiaceae bacterium]
MASLRESIRHFESRPSSRVFHAPQKAAQARAELEERLAKTGVKQPDTQRMYRAYLALQQAAATGAGGMESISIANLKLAPWVLFTPVSDGSEPLATDQDLVKAYLREVIRRARTSVTVALVAAFLMIYPRQLPIFNPLRKTLTKHVLPQMSGLRIEKWIACIENCDLLDEQAPKLLAKRLADDELPPSALLDRCCLRGLLANSALVEQAYREWITLVSDQLRANRSYEDSLTRLLTFARAPDNASKLRYESSRAGLANGLLLPFADASPSQEAAQRVKSFLLDTLGDPRLTGAKQWH